MDHGWNLQGTRSLSLLFTGLLEYIMYVTVLFILCIYVADCQGSVPAAIFDPRLRPEERRNQAIPPGLRADVTST
jgi:hypothetical protein